MSRMTSIGRFRLASLITVAGKGRGAKAAKNGITVSRKDRHGSKAWRVLASAGMIAVLAGCGSNAAPSASPSGNIDTVLKMPDLKGQTIVINTYGGTLGDALQKAVVTPFEAATGAKVVLSTNCCSAFPTQVQGQQFAGDVVLGTDYGPMQVWASEGLLKSDPRLAQIAKARGETPDLYQENMLSVASYAYVLAWNTKVGNDHPSSWADFLNTSKYTGTRGLYKQAQSGLEVAEMGAGTSLASVYPIDVNKSLDSLTALRKNASVHFYKDGADLMNQLGTGEIAYTVGWSNRIAVGIKQGLPVAMSFNQAIFESSGAGIPATAKNVDGAVAFLDFYLSPKIQAAFANESGMSPAYPAAAALVDPSLQKYMVTSPENLSQTLKLDNDWWHKNAGAVQSVYTKWITGS